MLERVGDASRVGVRCVQQLASPSVELLRSHELGRKVIWGPAVFRGIASVPQVGIVHGSPCF